MAFEPVPNLTGCSPFCGQACVLQKTSARFILCMRCPWLTNCEEAEFSGNEFQVSHGGHSTSRFGGWSCIGMTRVRVLFVFFLWEKEVAGNECCSVIWVSFSELRLSHFWSGNDSQVGETEPGAFLERQEKQQHRRRCCKPVRFARDAGCPSQNRKRVAIPYPCWRTSSELLHSFLFFSCELALHVECTPEVTSVFRSCGPPLHK